MLALGRSLAYRFLLVQLLVGLAVAVFWYALSSSLNGLGALVGAAVALAGNAFFVFAVFRHAGASQARKIATALFVGEVGKLLIVVSGFAAVFLMTHLPALSALTGFIATQAVFWVSPLIFRKSGQVKHA